MALLSEHTPTYSGRSEPLWPRRLVLLALLLAVTVNGGVLFWLWLKDGGITQATGIYAILTSAGRITGLLGAYLALLQVLLLARLPPLERSIGLDRLTVWHRINGKLVIELVVAHVVLITIGYAGTARTGWLAQFADFLSSYPGMITATVGTGLMIIVVVSSLVIARRRLPYEAWYAVHLTVYGGIYLAYLHQIPSGNEFISSTVQSDWWLALYLATLALLLVYRFVLPAVRALSLDMRVAGVEPAGAGAVSITVSGRRLDRLGAVGGQFMVWRFISKGLWWQAHPFSLSASPDGRTLRLTVKAVGGYTRALRNLPVGTRVYAEGPYGRFVAARRHRERVTLIAGGIGVTPLRAILEELHDVTVTFLYRVLTEDELVLSAEIEQLVIERGGRWVALVGDHNDPRQGDLLGPENLRELVPDIAGSDVFLCGPMAMMHHTIKSLERLGVPRSQIHTESFAYAAS